MSRKEYKVGLFVWTATGITALCIAYGFFAYRIDDRGVFGDMFGALTAWFSGLAFAGIIYTILQQKTELGYQREELRLTREEFKTQNETLRKQRFENTLFNLFSQHNKIVDGIFFIEIEEGADSNQNYDAFRQAHSVLKRWAMNHFLMKMPLKGGTGEQDINLLSELETEQLLDDVIKEWFNKNPHNFHLYFQSLQRILKVIHRSRLIDSPEERKFYASLMKDQISYYEIPIILYVGLIPDNLYRGLTFYINEYRILDPIDDRALITRNDKRIFDKWAIKDEPQA